MSLSYYHAVLYVCSLAATGATHVALRCCLKAPVVFVAVHLHDDIKDVPAELHEQNELNKSSTATEATIHCPHPDNENALHPQISKTFLPSKKALLCSLF